MTEANATEGGHGSVWLNDLDQRADTSRPLTGDETADVAVVGAGIVGLTAALLAVREGNSIVLLDGARAGTGTTGGTTGKVTAQPGLAYADLIDRVGEERARQYADANMLGVARVRQFVEELAITCDLRTADSLVYSRSHEDRERVEREVAAAVQLGLPASLVTASDLPFAIDAGVQFSGQLHLHPGHYIAGLAEAFVAAGGIFHEQVRVTDVTESDGRVHLQTEQGVVTAGRVVLATLLPPGLTGGYFARTRPQRSYGIAARLRGPAPESMTISIDSPIRSTRPWVLPGALGHRAIPGATPERTNGLIIVGNGHAVGDGTDTLERYADLERWVRHTFDVEAIEHTWSAHDYLTPDRIPYIGVPPFAVNVLVATGFGKWGLSAGTAAAVLLADLIAGRDTPWGAVFDAGRHDSLRSLPGAVVDNVKVGVELVTRQLRTDDPRCTHLGCRLRWNPAETSWDCYCHGSRFDATGAVLTGPATRPITLQDGPTHGDAAGPS